MLVYSQFLLKSIKNQFVCWRFSFYLSNNTIDLGNWVTNFCQIQIFCFVFDMSSKNNMSCFSPLTPVSRQSDNVSHIFLLSKYFLASAQKNVQLFFCKIYLYQSIIILTIMSRNVHTPHDLN